MIKKIGGTINNLLSKDFRRKIVRKSSWNYFKKNINSYEFIELISDLKPVYEIEIFKKSHSQILQDIFVINKLNFKKKGFFVEFGATDGNILSNTYLLEKEFEWDGILVEPSKFYHEELKKNRSCNIDTRCVFSVSGEDILFNDLSNKLSTIDLFSDVDKHKRKRKNGNKYKVQTVSLEDLLEFYNSPKIIDYISIDTEGSEYEILSNFNFEKYKFRIITVEHNFTENRDKIKELLSQNGYKRVFVEHSKWDDWYIGEI